MMNRQPYFYKKCWNKILWNEANLIHKILKLTTITCTAFSSSHVIINIYVLNWGWTCSVSELIVQIDSARVDSPCILYSPRISYLAFKYSLWSSFSHNLLWSKLIWDVLASQKVSRAIFEMLCFMLFVPCLIILQKPTAAYSKYKQHKVNEFPFRCKFV